METCMGGFLTLEPESELVPELQEFTNGVPLFESNTIPLNRIPAEVPPWGEPPPAFASKVPLVTNDDIFFYCFTSLESNRTVLWREGKELTASLRKYNGPPAGAGFDGSSTVYVGAKE
jgi:hypothetical protein